MWHCDAFSVSGSRDGVSAVLIRTATVMLSDLLPIAVRVAATPSSCALG